MTCLTPQHAEPRPWQPLQGLPHFEPRQVALHNRLLRACAPWQATLAGEPLSVQWAGGAAASAGELADSVVVCLTLDDRPVELRVPAAMLALFDWTPGPSAVRSDSDAMLLELAWLGWIEPLEALLGVSVRVSADEDAGVDCPVVVPLVIRVGDRAPFSASLHTSLDAAERIADWLDQHRAPHPDPLPALHFPLAVETGEAPLTLSELRSLNPGDVVMLDCPPERRLRLRLGEHLHCLARRDDQTLECLAALAAIRPDRNLSMTDTPTPDASELDAALDELPLRLVCQVGSIDVTLAQLRELGPGSLLQLTTAAQDGVDLMVNGRRVGRGELVSIGDALGVRLLGFCAP